MDKQIIIKPRCKRTAKHGWLITSGSKQVLVEDKQTAISMYKETQGEKTLMLCDAGYIIPILREP
jgi:hypothetical protein